jgi:hypothetical protein
VFFRQLFGLFYHTRTPFRGRRQNYFGTKPAHYFATLDGERVRHRCNEGIALCGTNHGQSNSGVTGRCFHDGLAGLQHTALLGVIDDRKSKSVFHRRHRIERFDLDENFYVPGRHAL